MTPANEASADRLLTLPGMMRVPTPRLEMFMLRGFLSDRECASLIARIDRDRRPSTIADANGDHYFRTSETCDLPMQEPEIVALDEKISAISGIDRQFGEALLHNKVMDSLEESDVIDGLDAQTDPAEVSHDQLARV